MEVNFTFSNKILDNDEEDGGAAGGDDVETVINIVEAHRLQEITLEKKVFMGYIKGTSISISYLIDYLKKVKAKLEENGKADRVATFQKGATAFVKHIVEKFDEIQFFTGETNDYEAGLAYCY